MRLAARLAPVLLVALATAPSASAAPPTNSAGHCLTPVAADGHEPPCNPFVASTAWSTNHRASYAQGSSPFPAPHPGDDVIWQDLFFENEIPVILQISEPYPDGGRTVWFSTVAAPESRAVYKIDYQTGEVLARASIQDEGGQSQAVPSTSGVYNLLDRDNHLISVRDTALAVHGDVRPGERTSPIELLQKFELPPRSKCRASDRIIGITLTYTGEVAFATVQGMVGVVPREPERMREGNLAVASINGSRCQDASVPDSDLEEVSNSISADEDGGIYVVSTKAQYRFDLRGGALRRAWRAEYASGGGSGGSTLSSGSGSTPDVVGTDPRDDKLVAITDGQRLMHLTLFWRDEIPADWKGLPNRDRRIACEFPVTFGDPNATESITEQSVMTRGYSFVVVNNALTLDRAFALIPPALKPLSALSGNLERQPPARHGADRLGSPHPDLPQRLGQPDRFDPQRDPDHEHGERARLRRRRPERLLGARGDRLRHRRVEAVGPDHALPRRELVLRGDDGRPRRRYLDWRHIRDQRLPRADAPGAPARLQGPRAAAQPARGARPPPSAADGPANGGTRAHARPRLRAAEQRVAGARGGGDRPQGAARLPSPRPRAAGSAAGYVPAVLAATCAHGCDGPSRRRPRASCSAGASACRPAATGVLPGDRPGRQPGAGPTARSNQVSYMQVGLFVMLPGSWRPKGSA